MITHTHETGGTICYGHWVLRLPISHTRQGVRFVTGIGFCVFVISQTRQGVRFVTGGRSASCDITHEIAGTTCYGLWVLRPVISHTRQGVRLVTGIGFCVL